MKQLTKEVRLMLIFCLYGVRKTLVPGLLCLVLIPLWSCSLQPISKADSESNLPVISGYVSPDDTLVQISVGRLLLLNKAEPFSKRSTPDARVELLYRGKRQVLLYNTASQYYEGIAHFRPAEKVSLFVRLTDSREATAQTVIPDSIGEIKYRYLGERTFELSWKNRSATTYYYTAIETSQIDNRRLYLNVTPLSPDTYMFRSTLGQLSTVVTAQYSRDAIFNTDAYQRASATLNVTVLDSAHYFFREAAYKQDLLLSSPFQERNSVYSNISGGVGVFGSYCMNKKVVKLNQP